MLITKASTFQSGVRKYAQRTSLAIGPFSLRVITVVLLAALLLFYLAQSTAGATKAYQIQKLEDLKHQLNLEKERLQIEAIRLKSLNSIKDTTSRLNLEPAKLIN